MALSDRQIRQIELSAEALSADFLTDYHAEPETWRLGIRAIKFVAMTKAIYLREVPADISDDIATLRRRRRRLERRVYGEEWVRARWSDPMYSGCQPSA